MKRHRMVLCLLPLMLLCAGCEPDDDEVRGELPVTPATTTLTGDEKTVILTADVTVNGADPEPIVYPLEWSVGDPSNGSVAAQSANSAVYSHLSEESRANIGAGLDTRNYRLGRHAAEATWYELDVPESIELRRRFFQESERYRFLASSMFEASWMDDVIDKGRPVLVIAEGLFMYFDESRLRPLMGRMAERFPRADMLVEIMGPTIVGTSKKHDSLSKLNDAPEFKWGLANTREVEGWHPAIRFVDEWCYFDYHKARAGLVGCIVRLPFIRRRIFPRIARLRFNGPNMESD
jgi:hypothetical protein